MARALKWIGIGLGGLVGIIVLAALILSFVGNARLHKTLDIQPEALSIPTDQASLERGEHLLRVGHGPPRRLLHVAHEIGRAGAEERVRGPVLEHHVGLEALRDSLHHRGLPDPDRSLDGDVSGLAHADSAR